MKVYITKSKRGHYTVTVYVGNRRVWTRGLISHIIVARDIAKVARAEVQASLDAPEPWIGVA